MKRGFGGSLYLTTSNRPVLSQRSRVRLSAPDTNRPVNTGFSCKARPREVTASPDLAARFPAGELIKPLAAEVGGTGGGRPEMAQAGGKHPGGLEAALAKVFDLVGRRGET